VNSNSNNYQFYSSSNEYFVKYSLCDWDYPKEYMISRSTTSAYRDSFTNLDGHIVIPFNQNYYKIPGSEFY
jgi:hypothetical protein